MRQNISADVPAIREKRKKKTMAKIISVDLFSLGCRSLTTDVCVPVSALPQMVSQAKEDIGTVLSSIGLDLSFKISCIFYFNFTGQIVNLHKSCKRDIIGYRHSWALAD